MSKRAWDSETLPQGDDKVTAVRQMFDAIAPRYDMVNRIMTFRLDVRWRRKAVKLLALPQRPEAVFSASDFSIVGAMQVVKEHGLRTPQDVALAGFSNETFTSLTEPKLTSVDQRCEAMGQAAIGLLLEMVQERGLPLSPRTIVLQPELLVRESSDWGTLKGG